MALRWTGSGSRRLSGVIALAYLVLGALATSARWHGRHGGRRSERHAAPARRGRRGAAAGLVIGHRRDRARGRSASRPAARSGSGVGRGAEPRWAIKQLAIARADAATPSRARRLRLRATAGAGDRGHRGGGGRRGDRGRARVALAVAAARRIHAADRAAPHALDRGAAAHVLAAGVWMARAAIAIWRSPGARADGARTLARACRSPLRDASRVAAWRCSW